MISSYPLYWPPGRLRTPWTERSEANFRAGRGTQRWNSPRGATMTRARRELLDELRLLGVEIDDCVISTNVPVRKLDGLPYANRRPDSEDPGVAVWFEYLGASQCFSCDRWDRVADNLYAVAKTINALRGIERWGSGEMMQAAFRGFTALPPMTSWAEVLGIPDTTRDAGELKAAWRAAQLRTHPDHGGSREALEQVNEAYKTALELIGP